MIFKLRKTKRKEMIIYIGSGHMTGGCVMVRDKKGGVVIGLRGSVEGAVRNQQGCD